MHGTLLWHQRFLQLDHTLATCPMERADAHHVADIYSTSKLTQHATNQ